GPGRAHQPQVDDWQRVEIESPQVVLYAALQLVRGIGGEDAALRVATRADLADDDQLRRVRVKRIADELVHNLGPIELRGVDVIDTVVNRLAQDRDRFTTIIRWPEQVRSGEPHRAVPDGRRAGRGSASRSGWLQCPGGSTYGESRGMCSWV